jgi:hypothetical protein
MVSFEQLSRLPLMHGSLFLKENWEKIKAEGVRPPPGDRKGINTFEWDVALGRHKYVFIKPPAVSPSYSYGLGDALLVHPAVLEKPGVYCLLHDPGAPGGWFQGLHKVLMMGKEDVLNHVNSYICDPNLRSILLSAASQVGSSDADEWETAIQKEILRPEGLPRLYAKCELSPATFFSAIIEECNKCGFSSVDDFVKRTCYSWPLTEEICVPGLIEPDLIIGRLSGSQFTPLSNKRNDVDVEGLISVWNDARRKPRE